MKCARPLFAGLRGDGRCLLAVRQRPGRQQVRFGGYCTATLRQVPYVTSE